MGTLGSCRAMLEAAAWGLAGGSSLVIGAALGLYARLPRWVVGLVLGFGGGALISAISVELAEESLAIGGADAFAAGLAAGAVVFYLGDRSLESASGRQRGAAASDDGEETTSRALLLGALLDGIPESAVIGLSLIEGGEVSVAVLAAVFVSNLPEAIGGASGMRSVPGTSDAAVLRSWVVVALAGGVAAGLGFALLDGASENTVGFIEAFAAGSLLTMLADEMFPAAHAQTGPPVCKHAPRWARPSVGLFTALGFAVAFALSAVG